MANLATRNVLICVVPAVVILLSVYWFRKKKKMKPEGTSPVNNTTVPASKTNDPLDNHGDIYSSVESTYDYSNTLSDASSISSPENSAHTSSICETPSKDASNVLCVKEPLSVSNHTDHLNYQNIISVSKEEKSISNKNSQILNVHKCENKPDSVSFINEMNGPTLDHKNIDNEENQLNIIEEKIKNSLPPLDLLELYTYENGQNSQPTDHSSDFSNGYNDSCDSGTLFELKNQKPNSDVSESSSIGNIVEEPVVTKAESSFTTSMLNCETGGSMNEYNKNETDSHSSVLDENSLSSISDESERHINFKYKDSPSSVFDGNSICDESEKTDVSNEEHVSVHLKLEENCKDNAETLSNEVESSLCVVPNNEQYSVQLNKNSFFTKTILEGVVNEVSSSSCIESVTNSTTSSLFGDSLLPDSFQTSSEEPFSPSKNDSGALVESNIQCTQQDELDSGKDTGVSSPVTVSSLTEETVASNSDVISCKTSPEACELQDGQSEAAVFECDTTVTSSTDLVAVSKSSPEVSSSTQLDSVSTLPSSQDAASVKAQEDQLEPLSQDKVTNLEGDVKVSAAVPGLFVYEFDLPQELCGRLIGKQGKHVKSIKERTNANVFIKRHPFDTNLKTVVVEGSRNAVHSALDIIRRKFPPSQFPTVSLVQTNMMSSHGVPLPESLQLHLPEGASCDVILSSLVNAGHFFLQQPTHPTYPSLSTLDQCMTNCYGQVETPLLPHPVEPGVICAAPMGGWYRGQVVYVYENRNECEVKFVDYGGFSTIPTSSLRQIRSDFMTLPFQASECYLANVRPVDRSAGWSSEATSVFEELAQGQILQALLVEYAEDGIPCVHLYKVQGVSNMFINRELVERGLAVWVDNSHWDPH